MHTQNKTIFSFKIQTPPVRKKNVLWPPQNCWGSFAYRLLKHQKGFAYHVGADGAIVSAYTNCHCYLRTHINISCRECKQGSKTFQKLSEDSSAQCQLSWQHMVNSRGSRGKLTLSADQQCQAYCLSHLQWKPWKDGKHMFIQLQRDLQRASWSVWCNIFSSSC